MKKTLLIITSVLSIGFGSVSVLNNSVFATSGIGGAGGSSTSGGSAPSGGGGGAKNQILNAVNEVGGTDSSAPAESLLKKIINGMLFLVGVLSVIMIIYGGIQFVLSVGNSTKITNAKNTILYAIVGLVVSIMAYAIVNFVIKIF